MTNKEREILEWIRRKEAAIAKCNNGFLQANLRAHIADLQRQLHELRARSTAAKEIA
jgi:hypothetical protein